MRTFRLLVILTLLAAFALPLAADEPTLVIVLNRWKGKTVLVQSPGDDNGVRRGVLYAIGRDHVAVKEGRVLRYLPVASIREVLITTDDEENRPPVIVLR
ncbi:MAG TPA: hypothetical protein VGF69_25395 [Thermoanaerobaculia bacterium]|jgi:hypothetical protein